MWAIFKVLTELLAKSPLVLFWFLAEQHVGLQLPNQESTHPAMEGEVPSAELPGKSPTLSLQEREHTQDPPR